MSAPQHHSKMQITTRPIHDDPPHTPWRRRRSTRNGMRALGLALLLVAGMILIVVLNDDSSEQSGSSTSVQENVDTGTPQVTMTLPPPVFNVSDPSAEQVAAAQAELDSLTAQIGQEWDERLSAAVTYYCRKTEMPYEPGSATGQQEYLAARQVAETQYDFAWRYDAASEWPYGFSDALAEACP